MKPNYIVTLVVALVVGALSFYGGMKYQSTRSPRGQFVQFGNREGAGGITMRGRGDGIQPGNFNRVIGEIITIDQNGITVKLSDGSSKIILLSEKTSIDKTASATKDDLKTGTKVAVFGSPNADGSVSATNVQIDPVAGNNPRPGSN